MTATLPIIVFKISASLTQIAELLPILDLPHNFVLPNRVIIPGESGFLLFLYMMSKWHPLVDVARDFLGHRYTTVSVAFSTVSQWFYATHGWRITDNMTFWYRFSNNFELWNVAIRRKNILNT